MIEQTLRSYLLAQPAIAALIGERVYPLVLPQGAALPAITYQRISSVRESSHEGPSGLAHPRFQLNCWSGTYAGARAMADAVRPSVNATRSLGQATFLVDDHDDYDPETGLYRVILDVILWHGES